MPAVSPIVHARSAQVGIGERESRRYWGQQLVVRGQLHSPMGKLVMRAAHVAPIRAWCFNSKRTSFHVALELEHMESVDLRSEIRKADAVLPVFARAGQRSDTLKRVARRGRCRLLFLLGVQHIMCVCRYDVCVCRCVVCVWCMGVLGGASAPPIRSSDGLPAFMRSSTLLLR